MAKYKITYSCGHDGEVQLFGANSDRDRKIKWLEQTQVCPACSAEKKAKAREAELKDATDKSSGLPQLVGSEKQINWAIQIRQKMIDSFEILYKEIETAAKGSDSVKHLPLLREVFKDLVLGNTNSTWFIDRRNFGTVRMEFGETLEKKLKEKHPEIFKTDSES